MGDSKRMNDTPYVLAALDMDGTLLGTNHETTPYTRQVLTRAAEAGKVIALCTGRCLSELWAHFEAIPAIHFAICESGGCLYDAWEKRVLRQMTIPDALMAHLLDMALDYDVCLQCFLGGQSYIQIDDVENLDRYHIEAYRRAFETGSLFVRDIRPLWREKRGAEKINFYFASEADTRRFGERLEGLDLFVTASLGYGFELSPPEASKSKGLEALCRHLGIPLSRTVAVGDGGNDLDLMEAAGFSVAMGNAEDDVRAVADATTEDNDHDGAARAVARYLLGEEP